MIHIKNVLDRVTPLGAAATLLVSVAVPALAFHQTSAAALTNRSLMVSSTVASDDLDKPDGGTYTGLAAGDPRNGQKVSHTYTFTPATTGDVEGITIEYCQNAFDYVGSGACTATNLLATNGADTGFSASAWGTKTVTVGGEVYNITAPAPNYLRLIAAGDPAEFSAGVAVTIEFEATATDFFVNPIEAYKSTSNGTYFAQIQTYADEANALNAIDSSLDEPTGMVDNGTVTNNITSAIGIYTRVQETLNFSVEGESESENGGTITVGPTPASTTCAPLVDSGNLKMGDPNSALIPDQANKVTSYFRLSTNASNGTNVYYSGNTLTNSSETYSFDNSAPVAGGTAFSAGTEAFGIGVNVIESDFSDLTAASGYENAENNAFSYEASSVADPKVIASVASDTVNCDTGRVDYMASTAPDTPAGIYQTKINYIASPRY